MFFFLCVCVRERERVCQYESVCVTDLAIFTLFFQNERRLRHCLIDPTSVQSPPEGRRKVNVVTGPGGRHIPALH